MKLKNADKKYEAFYQGFTELLQKHGADLTSIELLAVASNLVGKLVAMQDQRTTTPQQAMEVVIRNLELGNQQAVQQLMDVKPASRV